MTEKFLKAKHWQLFLLTFGIPMILQFVMMGIMFANMGSGNNPDPTLMLNYIYFSPIMMIIFNYGNFVKNKKYYFIYLLLSLMAKKKKQP